MEIKKAVRRRPLRIVANESALFLRGDFGLDDGLFALDVGFAAFLVFGFIELLSHIVFTFYC